MLIKSRLIIYIVILNFIFVTERGFGQNKIGLSDLQSWSSVDGGLISPNGKFCLYETVIESQNKRKVTVKEMLGNKQWELSDIRDLKFSENSKYLFGMLPNDTMFSLNLEQNRINKISEVTSYQLYESNGEEHLIYVDKMNSLFFSTLNGRQLYRQPLVNDYQISPNKKYALIIQNGEESEQRYDLLNLQNWNKKEVFNGKNASGFIFSDQCNQIAYFLKGSLANSIWIYNIDGGKSSRLIDSSLLEGYAEMAIAKGRNWGFSKDGKYFFFDLVIKKLGLADRSNKSLSLWDYRDVDLKITERNRVKFESESKSDEVLSIIDIQTKKFKVLTNQDDKIVAGSFTLIGNQFFVVKQTEENEVALDQVEETTYYLINATTGERKLFAKAINKALTDFTISPQGKYIICYDPNYKTYLYYNLNTNEIKQLGKNMMDELHASSQIRFQMNGQYPVGIAGWVDNDESLIVHGRFDLFQFDLNNNATPKNITKGFGKANNLVFYVCNEKLKGEIGGNGWLVLSGFNLNTKDYGFYKLNLRSDAPPQKLYMGAVYVSPITSVYTQPAENRFIKAKKVDAYLVMLENVNSAPNYFYSNDLTKFVSISENQPHKKFKWMTSELHNYSDSAGTRYQGVLYKPDDFDSKKKYPVIFSYYEQKSNLLNSFQDNILPPGDVSLPLLISNDYLVFFPDMRGEDQFSGEGIMNSIIAAADHVSKLDGIDAEKLAIVGFSFGGFETNWIVTATHRFAAAISGCGVSSLIALATDLRNGTTHGSVKKLGMDPIPLIRNSPILFAKNITTPLLLVHNDADNAVNYQHSQNLFLVLRGLGKQSWWLNYKGEGHGIDRIENRIDYQIKTLEFFDYFLKGASQPQWMKEHY